MTVPNVIHFCFGLKADFGQRPFSFVHYLAVKTALRRFRAFNSWLREISFTKWGLGLGRVWNQHGTSPKMAKYRTILVIHVKIPPKNLGLKKFYKE